MTASRFLLPPGPRLTAAFLLTAIIAGLALVALERVDVAWLVPFGLISISTTPFLWKGVRHFTHASATLLVTIFPFVVVRPQEWWVTALSVIAAIIIAMGRGFAQLGGRFLEPIVWGIGGGGLAWALTQGLDLDEAWVYVPLWLACVWGFAGVGEWCAARGWLRLRRGSLEQPRPVAMVLDPRWESWSFIVKIAVSVAFGLEVLGIQVGREQHGVSLLTNAVAVACLLLLSRGVEHFRSAFITFIPLGIAAVGSKDRELAFCAALVAAWIWGALHGRQLWKVVASASGMFLVVAASYLGALHFYDPVSPGTPIVGHEIFGYGPGRVVLSAVIALLLHRYPFAADALADWFIAKAHDRQPAPPAVKAQLSAGDVELIRAHFLLSGTAVRLLALGSLILAMALPSSAIKQRSMRDNTAPAEGNARSELLVIALHDGPLAAEGKEDSDIDRERREYPYATRLAVSRKITFGELRVVTGRSLPHMTHYDALPAILDFGQNGLPLIAAVEYCDALSRIEGLEQCYSSRYYDSDVSCTGYRLPMRGEWKWIFEALKSSTHGSLLADLYDGKGELVQVDRSITYQSRSGEQPRFLHSAGTTCGRTKSLATPNSMATLPDASCAEELEGAVSFRVVRTFPPPERLR